MLFAHDRITHKAKGVLRDIYKCDVTQCSSRCLYVGKT